MFDSHWYARISCAAPIPTLYPDHSNFDGKKMGFLSDQIENPELVYIGIEPTILASRINHFQELQRDILSSEKNPVVRQLYLDRITQELDRVHLYQAVLHKDTDQFSDATAKVFGMPQKTIWQDIITRLQNRKNYSASKTPALYQIIEHYQSHHTIQDNRIIQIPEQNTIGNLQKELFNLFPFLQLANTLEELDAHEIIKILNQALNSIGAQGWTSEMSSGSRTAICVMNRKKIVLVPQTKKIPAAIIGKLIAHEICTHVYRSTVAEHSPLQLLRYGLDHYLMAEEGLATATEQILSGKFKNFSGEDKYFAIGLVQGLDGTKRDFRATYEIMREYYFLKFPSKDADQLKEKAWKLCVRIFRGTPTNQKGVCYTKDIIYREGNIKIWQLLIENPAMYPHLFLGKYDPTNLMHIAALKELGLL